jgi:hypothetical protein
VTEQAANTTQTTQSSNGQQSQSDGQQQGSNGASNNTQATSRPEYVPEQFWDATANTVKAKEFSDHLGNLTKIQTDNEARLKAVPAKPDAYELKLPEAFKPEIPVAFNKDDPRIPAVRALAHELGLGQDGFSKLLQLEAGRVVAEHKAANAAREAEMGKLGANGTARVTAVKTALAGVIGEQSTARLLNLIESADDFGILEKLQTAYATQGDSGFNGNGRNTAADPEPKTQADRIWPSGFQQKAS